MKPGSYPLLRNDGEHFAEYTLCFDRDRPARLLVVPALFDEGNRMRRLTVDVMRRLDAAGIDCFLPDLPGTNESLQPLGEQNLILWREAMEVAAETFLATHVLAIRGGALVVPAGLPGWRYAPVNGATILRQMLRMQLLAAREAGHEETQVGLLERGLAEGLELGGYRLSPAMLAAMQDARPPDGTEQSIIGQDMIGGAGLWLRAEPGEDRAQADALAAVVALGLAA